ncbi:MAG: tetratricopeptide repeat protein [Planctomycetes bacterium]|nr:tetratricopeptide repeat protein [Planctomycetota bacterium]
MLAGSSSGSSSGRFPAGSGAYPAGSGAYPVGSGAYPVGSGAYPVGGGSASGRYEDPEIAFGRYLMNQGMIDQEQAREAYRLLQGYRQQHPQVNLAQVLAKHEMADRDTLRDAFQAFSASQSGQYKVGSSGSQLVQLPHSSQSGSTSPIPHTIDPDAMVGSGMFGQPSSAPIPHTIDPDAMVGSGMFGQPSSAPIPHTIDPDAMVGSGMFGGGAIPNTIDPDAMPGGGPVIPHTIDPDATAGSGMFGGGAIPNTIDPDATAGSGMFGGGAIPNTIDPDAMPGSGMFRGGAIPNTIDPDAMGGGPVIPHTMDPDAMGGGPVIPHTMDPDGPTMMGSGFGHPAGSGFGQPAGSGFGRPAGSGFGSHAHGSQFPPGSQGYGSQGPGSQGFGLLPSGSHGPQSRGPGGTRPDGSRGPHGTQPHGSRGPAGTQKQGTGFQLDLAPSPDKPSPFRNPNLPTPNSLSQVVEDEDEEEEADGKPRRKSARRRAAHPALRREQRKPLWIVLLAGIAVVAAVGIGLSIAGSKSRSKKDLERWLNLPDDDARAKLEEGERLPPEVQEDPKVAQLMATLRETVAADEKKAEALTVLDELEKALTLDERKKICDRALELDPTLAKAWVERARIRFALDRRAAAEKPGSEPTDITKGARADLNQAIGFDETSAEAYLFHSELYLFENDGRAALGSLRRVEELDPDGALGRLARGLKEEMSRRYGDALTHYDRAIELNSKLVAAYLARARVYVTQGSHSKAIASADQAKSLDPSSSEAHTLLAEARYYASGRSDKGVVRILDQALELDPSNSRALALRSYVRLERTPIGQVISSPAECKRAVEDAERANGIRPELLAWLTLAEVAIWEEDDKTKAQKYAKNAIGLDGRNPDAFLLRARIRILANTYEEADRDLERVLTLAESRPGTEEITARALTMRAAIRVGNKDYTAAKDLLKRAIKLQDDLAEAHFYYAKVLHHDPKRQSGDWRTAEQEYSKAISKDGTLADAWFHRGALHIDRSRGEGGTAKEWEEGLDDLNKAEELMNAKYRAFFKPYYLDLMRGVAYYGLNEWDRAAKHLKRFVEDASPGEENYAKAKKMLRDIESSKAPDPGEPDKQ